MMSLFHRYATPLTLGLFAVSAVLGVALFFRVGQSVFHGMHGWLSLALLLPFTLHVWRNWVRCLATSGAAPCLCRWRRRYWQPHFSASQPHWAEAGMSLP